MSSLIDSLKAEISRVARKETKVELQALRKITTAHRAEIAELKRQLKTLASELKAVGRRPAPITKAVSTSEDGAKPVAIRFTAERFAALRARLGLTQPEMATLLGAATLSIHKWESGANEPRESQKKKISVAMKMGKKQARALIAGQ